MAPNRLSHEADSAVERLLLKSNGQKKTANDVFEVVVAMNHDRRADTALLLAEVKATNGLLADHCTSKVHMTDEEFRAFIARFDKRHDDRDAIVTVIENDLEDVRRNCTQLHSRAPRRKTDPETEDWGNGMYAEDQELGDLRRAWRFLKWVVIVVGGAVLVAVGDQLSHRLFGS